MSKNKPTILFLLHLPPPIHGAAIVGKSIYNSRKINEVYNAQYINILVSRYLDETGQGSLLKLIRTLFVWFKLLSTLLSEKPEMCYFALTTTGSAFYKDVVMVALLRMFRVKLIFHFHNKGVKNMQNKKVYNALYKFVFKDANVILLSKLLYQDISAFVPEKKVFICPNGIADARQKYQERSVKTKDDKPNILFLSNLIESKGVYVLLDACKLLDNKNIDFSCSYIGGEGDITANQLNEKIQNYVLEKRVKYLGRKYGAEKNSYWQNSDIFVFPTYYKNETFGLVNLEAMQYSLPVVSTFEGGIPDVVEDNVTGFIVQQKDVQALANKLEILIYNPELRKQMGEAGRRKYEEKFTIEKFEDNMINILNACL